MLDADRMTRQIAGRCAAAAVMLALVAGGCGSSPKPMVVGSMNSTEQMLLSEIVAQHLEHRLGQKVERRPNLGGTLSAFQALQTGEINLYPEYAGSIVTEILKEQPSADASLLFERAKGEMKRLAQASLFDPLGMDNPYVAVIRSDDPRASKVSTLSQAAEASEGWVLGTSLEFQQLNDGMPALSQYKLPMKAAPRSMDGGLFKALQDGTVTMIVGHATDGLLTQKNWLALRDDRSVFVHQQACLLVQQSLLIKQPDVQPALQELSGKFTTETMRRLNAMVDVGHQQPKDVAAAFLMQAGLK
jgi:osmoprotectant transport system substrate-binding protein